MTAVVRGSPGDPRPRATDRGVAGGARAAQTLRAPRSKIRSSPRADRRRGARVRQGERAAAASMLRMPRGMAHPGFAAHPGRVGSIAEHMTRDPLFVGMRTPVSTAKEIMAKRRVRHLPVVEAGEIVGLLSDHHLRGDADLHDGLVETVMLRDPLVVAPTASVPHVARDMLARGQRCVLVAAGRMLLGIFTSGDALALVGGGDDEPKDRHAPTCNRWGYILR
jgi:acetoin utilization protein AcuB